MTSFDNQESGSDVEVTQAARSRLSSALRRVAESSVLRLIAFGYLTICAALVVMETRFVYPGAYISSGAVAEPAERSGIEQVDYHSSDGTPLSGSLLHRKGAKNTVLFFHGNGTKAVWLDGWLQRLSANLNATVMVAEYRGYCGHDATPREAGVIADCQAARDFLCHRYELSKADVILYGRSLGGGCAAALAADGGAKLVILDRTFDRLVDVAAGKYPIVPVHLLMRNRYDSLERIAQYQGPLIQVHGTTDRLIPIDHAKRLFDSAACQPKHWREVPGLGHNDSLPSTTLVEIADLVDEIAFLSAANPDSAPPDGSGQLVN